MTEQQIEQLVQRVIGRLRPPVLVMVTAAQGYRPEIRQRLARCGLRLHLALADDCPDADEWRALGERLPPAAWQQALPPEPYRALVVPFLDYPLAAQLVSGNLQHPAAPCLHDALSRGLPVLALRYHCDPLSELNQLRGLACDAPYTAHMQTTLGQLAACGVTLCTLPALLATLAADKPSPAGGPERKTPRYVTIADVSADPACAAGSGVLLTDAAADFLKEKKNLTLNHRRGV